MRIYCPDQAARLRLAGAIAFDEPGTIKRRASVEAAERIAVDPLA